MLSSTHRRATPVGHEALRVLTLALLAQTSLASTQEFPLTAPSFRRDFLHLNEHYNLPRQGPPEEWDGRIPLKVTNACPDNVWPAILTQHGVGPSTAGFSLKPDESRNLWVGPTWQGRVWGRTNCTGSGDSASCGTGDCFGKLQCEVAGKLPATLAEFTLAGGIANRQTFYDISLVDGYNLPMAIHYIPARNTTFIPPNLTNVVCIGTSGFLDDPTLSGETYSNSSFPIPWEHQYSNDGLRDWCPWSLLAEPPTKPGDGIYPYPDDNIQRPIFSPCLSQCAATGRDEDCCAGNHDQPDTCSPSRYSYVAKSVCPDAYSYAYDDQTSTFIIPSGGGWEVKFCPKGRSTNILRTLGDQLFEIAETGRLRPESFNLVSNKTYIEKRSAEESAASLGKAPASFGLLVGTGLLAVALGGWW